MHEECEIVDGPGNHSRIKTYQERSLNGSPD